MNREDSLSVHIESSLPKSWEVEHTFHETLYEWMARAPWLAISGAAHGIIILVMWMIPWDMFEEPGTPTIKSGLDKSVEDPFLDPPPPEVPPELEKPPTEEPQIQDAEIADRSETDNDEEYQETLGNPDNLANAPFEGANTNDVIGIGPSGGGPLGDGRGGKKNLTKLGGAGTEIIVDNALAWLRAHQSPDGSWDSDGFMANCGHIQPGASCDGPGASSHDVGLTGLCMLAFLGNGNTTREGPYKEQVAKSIKWMKDQQDVDTGLYGSRVGHAYMYDHTIATLAMCEAYYFSRSPLMKRSAQEAINYVSRARNPYGAWRYDVTPGDNDTSVTGWAVFAMKSAEEGKLEIDKEAYVGAAQWIDEVTDQATGRTGYDTVGSASSRVPGLNDQYPTDKCESMTAVAILSRVFMGQDVEKMPIVDKGADLLRSHLPEWDPEGLNNDIYYWYYGSYALFQLGGPRWEAWNKAAKKALVDNQRQDGDMKGSWDPKDAWGHAGGRVYMTSLGVLCLEVYFRYARVLGGR